MAYNAPNLLLHFDGSDGGTTFTDSSLSARTLTPTGSAQTSVTQAKFGATSLYIDGTNGYVQTPYLKSDFDWWTDNFTIECRVYASSFAGWSSNGASVMIGNTNPTANTNYWSFGPTADNKLTFYYYTGSTRYVTSSVDLTLDAWNHIAVQVTGGNILLFINGSLVANEAINGTPQSSESHTLTIGQYYNVRINGYVDELRIIKGGDALYTGAFIPPTSPFTSDPASAPTPPLPADAKVTHLAGETLYAPPRPNAKVTELVGETLLELPRSTAKVTELVAEFLYVLPPLQDVRFTSHSGGTYWTLSGDDKILTATTALNASTWAKASGNKNAPYNFGQRFFEVMVNATGTVGIGIAPATIGDENSVGGDNNAGDGGRLQYFNSGQKRKDGSYTSYGESYAAGDIIGIAVDIDAQTITCYKNGVSQGVMYSGIGVTDWVPHVCALDDPAEFQCVDQLTMLPTGHLPWGNDAFSYNIETRLTQMTAEAVTSATGTSETRLSRMVAEAVTGTTGTPEARLSRLAVEVVTGLDSFKPAPQLYINFIK